MPGNEFLVHQLTLVILFCASWIASWGLMEWNLVTHLHLLTINTDTFEHAQNYNVMPILKFNQSRIENCNFLWDICWSVEVIKGLGGYWRSFVSCKSDIINIRFVFQFLFCVYGTLEALDGCKILLRDVGMICLLAETCFCFKLSV